MSIAASRRMIATLIAVAALIGATFYPTNLERDYAVPRNGAHDPVVHGTEIYGRHINTILPLAIAVALRDWNGLRQVVWVSVGTGLATHGQKHLLNNVVVGNTRLGQRPRSVAPENNMPSGHSSTAAAGAWFAMRRYSMWLGVIVIPILILTMYTRYMLDAHTVSATIAGAMTGILVTSLFARYTPRFRRRFSILIGRATRRSRRTVLPIDGALP